MESNYSYRNEILEFLSINHRTLMDNYMFSENVIMALQSKKAETTRVCLYCEESKNSAIVLGCLGQTKDKILYVEDEIEVVLFQGLLEFAKYLEVCKLKNISKENLLKYAKTQIQLMKEVTEDDTDSDEIIDEGVVCENLQGYIKEEDQITLTEADFERMIFPDKIVIEDEVIGKADINAEVIKRIQKHLYDADYGRIELTYLFYMTHKKRTFLSHENSLVFQCEEGKTLVCCFDGKKLNSCTFFANRNGVGLLEASQIPKVMFRGREESEQHMLYDRSMIVDFLFDLLYRGDISYERDNKGYFNVNYFSNKNAYLKSKNLIGEYHYEVF